MIVPVPHMLAAWLTALFMLGCAGGRAQGPDSQSRKHARAGKTPAPTPPGTPATPLRAGAEQQHRQGTRPEGEGTGAEGSGAEEGGKEGRERLGAVLAERLQGLLPESVDAGPAVTGQWGK